MSQIGSVFKFIFGNLVVSLASVQCVLGTWNHALGYFIVRGVVVDVAVIVLVFVLFLRLPKG